MVSGKGRLADARRAFRQMLRQDGEITRLPTRRRQTRERRVLMLIDVSGSMKNGTDGALRLAHALQQGGDRVECFTLGTRLTRVTRALPHCGPASGPPEGEGGAMPYWRSFSRPASVSQSVVHGGSI